MARWKYFPSKLRKKSSTICLTSSCTITISQAHAQTNSGETRSEPVKWRIERTTSQIGIYWAHNPIGRSWGKYSQCWGWLCSALVTGPRSGLVFKTWHEGSPGGLFSGENTNATSQGEQKPSSLAKKNPTWSTMHHQTCLGNLLLKCHFWYRDYFW